MARTAPLPTVPLPKTEEAQAETADAPAAVAAAAGGSATASAQEEPVGAVRGAPERAPLTAPLPDALRAAGSGVSRSARQAAAVVPFEHQDASDSDLSDVDADSEDEKPVPLSSSGKPRASKPVSNPKSSSSPEKRKRASSSATPMQYGPARTRRMLAAEAALLDETPEADATEHAETSTAESGQKKSLSADPAGGKGESSPLSAVSNEAPQRAETPVPDPVQAAGATARASRSASKRPLPPGKSVPKKEQSRNLSQSRSRSATPSAPALASAAARSRESVQKRMGELIPRYQYLPDEEPGDYELVWARQSANDPWWPAEACVDLEDEEREIPEQLLENVPKACVGHAEGKELKSIVPNERTMLVNWFGHRREWCVTALFQCTEEHSWLMVLGPVRA